MSRAYALIAVAAVLVAAGCRGSPAARQPPAMTTTTGIAVGIPPTRYARLAVRGVFTSCGRGDRFGGDLCREHFGLSCLSERAYLERAGNLLPRERLCLAILDYATQVPDFRGRFACKCLPTSAAHTDIRGTIAGRPIHELITPCACVGARAQHDARAILEGHRASR